MQLVAQPVASSRSAAAAVGGPARASARAPAGRAARLTVRAQEVYCRDVVAAPRAPGADLEGDSQLVFVGTGGATREVVARKSDYILDSGMEAGLELPFTCRGGICGACVVRVTEGACDQSDVTDLSFTLSEEELADGMTLICMARPLTDRVVMETQSDWGYGLGVTEWKGATGHIAGRHVQPMMGRKWDTSK
eukprot:scaffold20.g7799.t1